MSKKKKAEKQPEAKVKNTHGRQVMMTTDGPWTVWRFEFDADDGQGVVWHHGCGTGPSNLVEISTRHFAEKGYTVIAWKDV